MNTREEQPQHDRRLQDLTFPSPYRDEYDGVEEPMSQDVTVEQASAEIMGHLMHAAVDGLSAVMQLGPLHLMGRLDTPGGEQVLGFILDREAAIMDQDVTGQTVRLEYWYGDTSSRFESRVVGREGSRIWLEPPGTVDRSDRRLVPRFAVDGIEGFRFLLEIDSTEQPMVLVDLSNTGIAFRAPADSRLNPGMLCLAWLGLPDREMVPVRIEIRNCRVLGSELLVGARMVDLRRQDRKSITQLIVGLRSLQER